MYYTDHVVTQVNKFNITQRLQIDIFYLVILKIDKQNYNFFFIYSLEKISFDSGVTKKGSNRKM